MDNLKKKLDVIDTLKRELDELRPLSTDIARSLKTLFDVEFTHNSTAIEGNTFSYQESQLHRTIGSQPVTFALTMQSLALQAAKHVFLSGSSYKTKVL